MPQTRNHADPRCPMTHTKAYVVDDDDDEEEEEEVEMGSYPSPVFDLVETAKL